MTSADPLPILYLLDASTSVTGAFIAARNEARAMKDQLRIVLLLPRGHRIPAEALQDFWRVETLPIVSPSKRLRALLGYFPALVYTSWCLFRMMKQDGVVRLQLNDFFLMHGALLRLFGFRGHIVAWVRCEPRRFAGLLAGPMLWLARRSADRVVAVSSYIKSLLPSDMVDAVIHDYYLPVSQPQKKGGDAQKIFIYIGNYIPGKGQDMALKAFAAVVKQDASLRLVFHGGDMGLQKNREYLSSLKTYANQHGLEAYVTFGGFLPDTQPVLHSAFAALNFSVSESFSMTVLEASGAGLPVIATASGGPQEIIKEGETGYIIPVGDIAAATAQILKLAQNPAMAVAMGKAGAARIKQFYAPEQFAKALHSILKL